MDRLLPYQVDDAVAWDAFILENGGDFLQSWDWSRFQEATGRSAYLFRIAAEAEDRTLAQFMAVRHELPLGMAYAYAPRGPIVATAELKDGAGLTAALQAMRLAAGQMRCLFFRVEPPNAAVPDGWQESDLCGLGLMKAPAVQPADSAVVDLTVTAEELLSNLHPKTRYNIRVAERHGVTVRDADYDNAHSLRQDLMSFWRLMRETTERDGFRAHPQSYYEKMVETLSPRQGGRLQVRLVLAEIGNEVVAAALVAEYGGVGTYLHGASSARQRSAMAPQLLHWRIISDLQQRGVKSYDLYGVAPADADERHPWAGITRFKMGFGGHRVSYRGTWELTVRPFWYKLYRLAKSAGRTISRRS